VEPHHPLDAPAVEAGAEVALQRPSSEARAIVSTPPFAGPSACPSRVFHSKGGRSSPFPAALRPRQNAERTILIVATAPATSRRAK
jgi:hypothetical protein